jgi:hypothetical protein
MIFLSVLPILASASYGIRLFRPSPKRAGAWLAPPVKMRLAALLCHCRSWIQRSRFREQLFRFAEAFHSFLTSNPLGDPPESESRCYDAARELFARLCRRPHNFGGVICPFSGRATSREQNLWLARGGQRSRRRKFRLDHFRGRHFTRRRDWRCRCPKCGSQRQTNQKNKCARSTGKAGNGNRTRMASLEGWNFTIKLCPREK